MTPTEITQAIQKKITAKAEDIFHEYETATIDHIKDVITILNRINKDAWMKSTVTGNTVSVATEIRYYELILKEVQK